MSPNVSETSKHQPGSAWKRIALISIFAGAGVALVFALIAVALLWYSSRLEPLKLWNAKALHVSESPAFGSDDAKSIRFTYTIANATEADYKIEAAGDVRIMSRFKDGSLRGPIPEDALKLRVPVFIPVRQSSEVDLRIYVEGIPSKVTSESDEDYHGRLRKFLEEKYSDFAGFSVFDERNRYQIDLPKWSSEKKSLGEETDPLGLFAPYGAALAECLTQVNPNDPLGLFTDDPIQAKRRQTCIDRYRTK